ncbi:hypothetical protein LZC95_31750 [Pendulispora brunnea]|uniref:SRPBCC family protein n=1 Tax=Pendulispora brunnea TaxID=2905690 RepID=A0ABZ2K0E4_9BACT
MLLLALASLAVDRVARAQENALTEAELARIERGETVVRPQTSHLDGHRYVGGVTYTIVPVSAEELLALVDSETAYAEVMPRAKFVKRLQFGPEGGYMEVHHGNAFIDAAYTMHLKKEPAESRIRFWVDLSRPHDVEDAWGFFRYAPLPSGGAGEPRMLLTYGVLVNLGDGILRSLYEEKVRTAMLSLPQRLRRYVSRTFHR